MADQAAEQQQADAPATGRGGFRGRGANRGGRGGAQATSAAQSPDVTAASPNTQTHDTNAVKATKKVSGVLPQGSKQKENSQRQKSVATKEDSAFKEAVFGEERRLKPATREVDFYPASTGYTDLVNCVYMSYKGEKKRPMAKEFPVELLRYYVACLYWLRTTGIKYKTTRPLSPEEDVIYQALHDKEFCVPEPIFLALKAIGEVKLATGETIVPDFPAIPTTVVGNVPGTAGAALCQLRTTAYMKNSHS